MQSFCKFQNKYYLCGTDSKEYVYDKGNNSVSHLSDCSAYSIWAIDTNNVLLGNGDGYVSKFDGLSLSNVYTTDQYHVIRNFSASADDPNTIYAVGDKGIILKIVKTDVGIEDFKFSPDINIYPNPAKDFVTLDLGTASQTTQILIFDQTGKMVLRTETNKPKTTISLSNLDSGFYFIRGESANNSFTKKLLIKR